MRPCRLCKKPGILQGRLCVSGAVCLLQAKRQVLSMVHRCLPVAAATLHSCGSCNMYGSTWHVHSTVFAAFDAQPRLTSCLC
jgi:hypothetical protein